ncbi:MAG: hypothetical protein J5849_01345 [Clostridia bacterium]|nr:hypothetical protein [Clostridia bacterium]
MALYGKIDLHMHTTASDGTDTPEEIAARVREAGIGLFSVTDHDAIKAARIIPPTLAEGDPVFLTGAEFSCRDEEGKYHILGYGFDPDADSMRELVGIGHRFRIGKVKARLDFLKSEYGFSFPKEELEKLLSLDNPGKPHIANMMVRHGYAESKERAIKEYIDRIRFREEYVRPEEAIRGILDGGGIPVLAHPCYGDGDQLILGEEMEKRLRRLTDYGLLGVEAFYSGFTPRLNREMLSFAERGGLYVTAGSDYHGANKMVSLGDTGLGEPDEWPEGLRRFLNDVRK